jgi:hypothetical protein
MEGEERLLKERTEANGSLVHAGSSSDCTTTRVQEFSERPDWFHDTLTSSYEWILFDDS